MLHFAFADPYFSRDVSGHAGTHPKIQMGIVMTTDFIDKLRFTKNILRDFSGQRHVTLALVCKSGRHRSVAFAELLRSSLMRMGFWVDMMHYSAMIGQWRYICQGYNGCPVCAWSDDHWTMHNLAMELFTLCWFGGSGFLTKSTALTWIMVSTDLSCIRFWLKVCRSYKEHYEVLRSIQPGPLVPHCCTSWHPPPAWFSRKIIPRCSSIDVRTMFKMLSIGVR